MISRRRGTDLPFDPFDIASLHGWVITTRTRTEYRITPQRRLVKNGRDKGKIRLIGFLSQSRTLLLSKRFHDSEIALADLVRILMQQGGSPGTGRCLVALTSVRDGDELRFVRRTSSPIVSIRKT